MEKLNDNVIDRDVTTGNDFKNNLSLSFLDRLLNRKKGIEVDKKTRFEERFIEWKDIPKVSLLEKLKLFLSEDLSNKEMFFSLLFFSITLSILFFKVGSVYESGRNRTDIFIHPQLVKDNIEINSDIFKPLTIKDLENYLYSSTDVEGEENDTEDKSKDKSGTSGHNIAKSKEDNSSAGSFVASKNGKNYYLPWCSGANRIKEENKIWFKTEKEALDAGFSPSKQCNGML